MVPAAVGHASGHAVTTLAQQQVGRRGGGRRQEAVGEKGIKQPLALLQREEMEMSPSMCIHDVFASIHPCMHDMFACVCACMQADLKTRAASERGALASLVRRTLEEEVVTLVKGQLEPRVASLEESSQQVRGGEAEKHESFVLYTTGYQCVCVCVCVC